MSQAGKVDIPSGCQVCSFDIFDTLLYRRCGMPETVFALMESEWPARFGCPAPHGFATWRAGAEERARRRMGKDTVTIEEIYEDVRSFFGASAPTDDALIAFEMDLEKRVLAPVPWAGELVGRARSAGKRIVFTSDTYLPTFFLTGLLQDCGLMTEGDKLFASAEMGGSKATGHLYKLVQQELQLSSSAFLHMGDSEKVDVRRARAQGWKAENSGEAAWTRREWALWHLSQANRGLSPKVHAAARNARLAADVKGQAERSAYEIGAAVAGPVLVAFAQWVLDQARAKGLEELFFLSRDAQIVFEICKNLAKHDATNAPKLTYVYGSRQVWAFYALQSLPQDERAKFFADQLSASSQSLQECADLLGLSGNCDAGRLIASLQKASGGAPSRTERLAFYRALLADEVLSGTLQGELANRAALYLEYLRALPVEFGSRCGVVDIGWSGMWTEIVGAMFREAGAKKVMGLQMGRALRSHPSWSVDVDCFLFDQLRNSGIASAPGWLVPLVEVFCGADHGRVTSMDASSGTTVPVESSRKFGGMPEPVFRSFRAGVFAFSREWTALNGGFDETVGTPSALVEVLKQFWLFPTSGEARFVQGVDIGMAPNADQDRAMLRPYKSIDLLRLLTTSHLPGFEPVWWHRGALAITALPLAVVVAVIDSTILLIKSFVFGRATNSTFIPIGHAREHGKYFKWLFLPKS